MHLAAAAQQHALSTNNSIVFLVKPAVDPALKLYTFLLLHNCFRALVTQLFNCYTAVAWYCQGSTMIIRVCMHF